MVKDVDFADFKTLKTFYLFRLKDELDQILLSDDVEKEFRNRVRIRWAYFAINHALIPWSYTPFQ